ncbi:MAG: protein-L-isoaspartate(D-aspartate) O-methyltransferase [Methylococcales bacterium]
MLAAEQGIGMTSQRTRDRMVERLREQKIRNQQVLSTMRQIPRHLFVDEALASRAYEDTALPIGLNQTISQPYIVARMTELLLENGIPETVLEVGTGSGYQTAVLASLVPHVHSVERLGQLQQRARRCLQKQNLHNIEYLHSDGGWGWPDHAPYAAILVTAAPDEIPSGLLEQMAPGGVMVIPVGASNNQQLTKVIYTEQGFEAEAIEAVSFVPLLKGSQ